MAETFRNMRTVIERGTEAWAIAGGLLIFAIMAVTSLNVIGFGLDRIARLFGGHISGLPGYEDFVRLAIAGAALMFVPYCQARRGHVRVELLDSILPPGLRHLLDRLWLVATALLAGFLAYWMSIGLLETRADHVLSPVLGWPVWPSYLPGIISLLLWSVVAALQIFEKAENA